jgi:hypothetical protein
VKAFGCVTSAVVLVIGIGVAVLAAQGSPSFYSCATPRDCLAVAQGLGIRGPILVPSGAQLKASTGLELRDGAFRFQTPNAISGPPEEAGQLLWALSYLLVDPTHHRKLLFRVTDAAALAWSSAQSCPIAQPTTRVRPLSTRVAPDGRRFCYQLIIDHTPGTPSLLVLGRSGPITYSIANNAFPFAAFPGDPRSGRTLHWVEAIVGSLRAEPVRCSVIC